MLKMNYLKISLIGYLLIITNFTNAQNSFSLQQSIDYALENEYII